MCNGIVTVIIGFAAVFCGVCERVLVFLAVKRMENLYYGIFGGGSLVFEMVQLNLRWFSET
jgi:hypothetical protein